jgi:DNA-directed RNA polymerase specialized sigma24 family protein
LDFKEIAGVMDLSLATVERDWRFARAWLRENMEGNKG